MLTWQHTHHTSRIGKVLDFVPEIDNLPERVVIDEIHNQNGTIMCDFLLENKLAVVNGRVCQLYLYKYQR